MKILDLEFKNSLGHGTHFKLQYLKDDIDAVQLKDAMTNFAKANLFQKAGVNLYQAPVSADVVKTDEVNVVSF